jgi:hypothetical protein
VKVDWTAAITRRTAVKLGAASAVTLAGTQGAAMANAQSRVRARTGHAWRRSTYHPLVGTPFHVHGSTVPLRLTAIRDIQGVPTGSESGFELVFHSSRQRTFRASAPPRLHHPALGSVNLFVSPGESTARGQSFSAVINRVHA